MRKRCTWKTLEEHNGFALQVNEYEERRVARKNTKGRWESFRTFHGYNAYADCNHYWNNTVKVLF